MRRKIALYACVILGPLMILASVIGMVKDYRFASESVPVDAKILGQETIRASKGPDQVRFRVKLLFNDGQLPRESFLTVYESTAQSLSTSLPLKVAYLKDDPQSVRLPKEQGQAWMPGMIGLIMTFVGFRHLKKLSRLKAEILLLEKSLVTQSAEAPKPQERS